MVFSISPRKTPLTTDLIVLDNGFEGCANTESNTTHAWIEIAYEACNISLRETKDTHSRFANVQVEGRPLNPNSNISRSTIGVVANYSISCQSDRSQKVSPKDERLNVNGAKPNIIEQAEVSTLFDFNLTMQFYQDSTLTVPLLSPTVEVGEPIYLAVKNHNPEGLKILVDTCFASASPDPYKKDLYYMFLLDNCPYDETY